MVTDTIDKINCTRHLSCADIVWWTWAMSSGSRSSDLSWCSIKSMCWYGSPCACWLYGLWTWLESCWTVHHSWCWLMVGCSWQGGVTHVGFWVSCHGWMHLWQCCVPGCLRDVWACNHVVCVLLLVCCGGGLCCFFVGSVQRVSGRLHSTWPFTGGVWHP